MPALTEKAANRERFRRIRTAIEDREEKQAALTDALLRCPAFLDADRVFCYVSFGTEPSTRAFLDACLRCGKPLAVPKCEADGVMRFLFIRSTDDLRETPPYGIPEPPDGPTAEATASTFCVVPGLAFDRRGNRLGFGGGYYDRYLSTFPGFTMGLCFDECLTDRLVCDETDVPVRAVLTPRGILNPCSDL